MLPPPFWRLSRHWGWPRRLLAAIRWQRGVGVWHIGVDTGRQVYLLSDGARTRLAGRQGWWQSWQRCRSGRPSRRTGRWRRVGAILVRGHCQFIIDYLSLNINVVVQVSVATNR